MNERAITIQHPSDNFFNSFPIPEYNFFKLFNSKVMRIAKYIF